MTLAAADHFDHPVPNPDGVGDAGPRPCVLLVEDDPVTGEEIIAALHDHGVDAERLARGADVLDRASEIRFDAIILDRMLADGMDGLDVVAGLRAHGIGTPVLILSALSAVTDRVQGLAAGSDDYLVKPFDFLELTARVDALLRRGGTVRGGGAALRTGDLSLDLIGRSAERNGHRIDLLPREAKLLEFLMRHAGQVLTRAMIFESVWGYRFDDRSNTIDVHIGSLRRKLDRHGPAMIHTVRQAGYVLRPAL
jgi:two-component system, OmpR family, response regulator